MTVISGVGTGKRTVRERAAHAPLPLSYCRILFDFSVGHQKDPGTWFSVIWPLPTSGTSLHPTGASSIL